MSDQQRTAITSPVVERLQVAADGYLAHEDEGECPCIYCAAAREIQVLRSMFEAAGQIAAEPINRFETPEMRLDMIRRLAESAAQYGSEGATARCKRCGGSPVVAEVEGRTLVCATCRDDAEFRAHAERDYR